MNFVFTPSFNSMSPLNCRDIPCDTKVRPGDNVDISVVFTWDKPTAESMGEYYRYKGANVRIGGPAYDDEGSEFTPSRFVALGVTITHRGCPRNCPFCYVPRREGNKIRHLEVKEGNILQDNNILACNDTHREKVYSMLKRQRAVSFKGGLDARLLRDSDIEAIRGLRLFDLWTAYDSAENTKTLPAIRKLRKAGIPQNKIRCYVLMGFGGDTMSAAQERARDVFEAGGLPFAQLYDKYDSPDISVWKKMVRTWSRPADYKNLMKGGL